MKFCSKCGNAMNDDMLFCQKCGTKFEVTNVSKSAKSLEQLKEINMIIPPEQLNYEELLQDLTKNGQLLTKLNELKDKIISLGRETIHLAEEEDNKSCRLEVLNYYALTVRDLCRLAGILIKDSKFIELYNNNIKRYGKTAIGLQNFKQLRDYDSVYKSFSMANTLFAKDIKSEIPCEEIQCNQDLQSIINESVNYFIDAFEYCEKRFEALSERMGDNFRNTNVEFCKIFMTGLPYKYIKELDFHEFNRDKSCVNSLLAFKENVKETEQKEELEKQKLIKKREEEEYWSMHPNEALQKDEKMIQLSNQEENISKAKDELTALSSEKSTQERELGNIKKMIEENNQKIKQLEKKIIGKKKAEEVIQSLENENINLEAKYKNNTTILDELSRQIAQKENEVAALEKSKNFVIEEIRELRNKYVS